MRSDSLNEPEDDGRGDEDGGREGVIDLVQWLQEEFALSLDVTIVKRILTKLGCIKLTARPCYYALN